MTERDPESLIPPDFTLQDAMDHYIQLRNTTMLALSMLTGAVAQQLDAGALKRALKASPEMNASLGEHDAAFLEAFLDMMRRSAATLERVQAQHGLGKGRH